ncbi:MAG: hypothetical protein NZ773_12845 [Dehalococcoidia bacterium]|nr:hypothetical protein [Dehalococcoidia bacterium]
MPSAGSLLTGSFTARVAKTRLTPGLSLVVLGGALALVLWPLFAVSLPVTHDGLNHLQRLVAFDALLRSGLLYPRWYPMFASGYGYPLGNFYPPLALYVAELPLLAGAGPTLALKLAFALALGGAAAGAALFIGRVTGAAPAGVLGGVAFLAAPYFVATVYDRGALPEALALALLPWSLWAIDRWGGGRAGLPLLAALLAALVMTHLVVAAAGWALAALWWGAASRRPLWRLPLPFLIAAGLSAFVWLPAALEAPAVSLDNFARSTSAAANALPLRDLVDRALISEVGTFPYRLGLIQVVLAGIGFLAALPVRGARRAAVIALLLFAGCALAATTLAASLWAQPALQAVQFPWRLLGPASLFAALLIGFLARGRLGWGIALAGAALLLLGGVGGLRPADREVDDRTLSVGGAARREWTEGTIGTTTAAEYLPAAARAAYAPGPLPAAITADAPPLRSARLESWTPLGWRLAVVADEPTVLRLHQFAFPGWSAWVDGAPTPVRADGPLGLATVALPPGEHTVDVRFTTTPPRMAGALLSGLTAVGLGWLIAPAAAAGAAAGMLALGIALALLPLPRSSTLTPADLGGIWLTGGTAEAGHDRVTTTLIWLAAQPGGERLTVRLRDESGRLLAEAVGYPLWNTATRWSANELISDQRALAIPAGPARQATIEVEAAGRTAVVGSIALPARTERATPLANRLEARFGEQVALTGWEVTGVGPDRSLQPGGAVDLTLEWTALRSVDEDYTVFVHLIGPDGRRYGQSDSQPAAGLAPTTLLLPSAPLRERRRVPVAADAPPGRYQLEVGLYRLAGGDRLPLAGGGTAVTLGPFKIASRPASLPAVDPIEAQFGPIALAGGRAEPEALTLLWRAVEPPTRDLSVAVHLLDPSGRLVAQADGPPDAGRYPTSLWSRGELILDRRPLPRVAADRVAVWLYDPASGARFGEPALLPLLPR